MSALSAFYDAYWFAMNGRKDGKLLKAFGNVPQAEKDAYQAGLDARLDGVTLVADAGSDQVGASSPVTLDGSGSVDAVLYLWTEGGVEIAHGVSPTLARSIATHVITLHAIDADGNVKTDTVSVEVTS